MPDVADPHAGIDPAPTDEAPSAPETAAEATEAFDPDKAPQTVFDQLREDYAAAVDEDAAEERSEVFIVLPGRFYGNLGMRSQDVSDKLRRKRNREARQRPGTGREAVLNAQAQLIADATKTMLIRSEKVDGWCPMNEDPDLPDGLRSDDPIRWDARLCEVLGIHYPGTEYGVVRLVYRNNPQGLSEFAELVDAWLKEDLILERDEEGDGEQERPT